MGVVEWLIDAVGMTRPWPRPWPSSSWQEEAAEVDAGALDEDWHEEEGEEDGEGLADEAAAGIFAGESAGAAGGRGAAAAAAGLQGDEEEEEDGAWVRMAPADDPDALRLLHLSTEELLAMETE